MRTSVWPFTDFDCALFLNVPPLATGLASFVQNDTDLFPGLNPDRYNMNSVAFSAHGALYAPTGEKRQFSMVWRLMWDGIDFPSSYKGFTKIHLTGN